MGSGSRKTRNKTPTSMAKTPTSNIVGSGTLSRIIKELEKPDGFRILMWFSKNSQTNFRPEKLVEKGQKIFLYFFNFSGQSFVREVDYCGIPGELCSVIF